MKALCQVYEDPGNLVLVLGCSDLEEEWFRYPHNTIKCYNCKGFQSVARWLDLTTLGSRTKHLNLLSHGGVLFLINPGTIIRYTIIVTDPPHLASFGSDKQANISCHA